MGGHVPGDDAAQYLRVAIRAAAGVKLKWNLIPLATGNAAWQPVGITQAQCAAVSSLGTLFSYNLIIKSFNELRYFTITSLGQNALRNCSLEYLALPATLSSIGSNATYIMWRLRHISILCQTPPTLGNGNFDTFYGNIYVPDGSVSSYQSSWSSVTASIKAISEFDEHVTVYDEMIDRTFIDSSGNAIENWWASSSIFFPISGNCSLTFYTARTVQNNRVIIYNEAKQYVDYWNLSSPSRTVNISNAAFKYIRLSFRTVWLDDCYIKNNTTGEYLFKGVNVP